MRSSVLTFEAQCEEREGVTVDQMQVSVQNWVTHCNVVQVVLFGTLRNLSYLCSE